MSAPRVAVLGAGIAGLVAAREFARRGADVTVYEAAGSVAGMASTRRDPDGFAYDLGGHFITNRLAAALGVSAACRPIRRYDERVELDGRYPRYPMGLLAVPRFVAGALRARTRPQPPAASAAERFAQLYGAALAAEVAIPLVEAWSGVPAGELAPSVVDKIPSSLVETVYLRAATRVTGRPIAIGYCGTQPQSTSVWQVYPEHGVGWMCGQLARPLGDRIALETPVQKVFVQDGRVVGVRAGDREVDADVVVSTAPVDKLPRIVDGAPALERFARFRFRPLVFVNLKMVGSDLLPAVLTWFPRGRPFFRLTEATQAMPWLAPEGKTVVLAELGASIGDERWTAPDDRLVEECLDGLDGIVPDARARFLGAVVQRSPIAYPVFHRGYEADRQALEHSTGVE